MRILLLNHFPLTGSGSGVYTKNIADSLIKNNHEVCIIMPENITVNNVIDNIKIHPVYFKDKSIIKGQLPFNFPCFTTHPRSSMTFENLSEKQLNQYISAFDTAIKEEIEVFKPDVIHAGHIWILPYIASKYDVPLVITAHGTDLIGYQKSDRFHRFADIAIEKAKKIITISKDNKNLVLKTFNNVEDKVILIPNGYNPNNFYKINNISKKDILSNLSLPYTKNIVTFTGKFTSFKGIDILLKANQIYDNENTITILSGDGQLFNEMKELAKKLNLNNTYFLGNQSHDILNKINNISDVAIVPSRNEAFGLVVIEALACGVPVIGTNNGGIPDIINNTNGLLFEQDNYKELADKVNKVLNKEIKFNRKEIAEKTKEKYSQDKFTNNLVEIYSEIIK